MKIDGKTQPQRVYELMYYLFRNDGLFTSATEVTNKHHLDTKLIAFMQSKGIVERPSKRGAIFWTSKEPDMDMAIHTTRAFNKWLKDRKNEDQPWVNDYVVVAEEVNGRANPDHRVLGYRINILGLKFEIRKPVFRVEKIKQPF